MKSRISGMIRAGLRAHLGHVGGADGTAEAFSQHAELVPRHRDEHRLAARMARAGECLNPGQIVTLVPVEEPQVAQTTVKGRFIRQLRVSRSLPGRHTPATSRSCAGYAALQPASSLRFSIR